MNTPAIEDFAAIRAELERIQREKKETEAPKAWPEFSPVDYVYQAPDDYMG